MMFIDSPLPIIGDLNYAVIGGTAKRNPSFAPMISLPYFQIRMDLRPDSNGPATSIPSYVGALCR